MKKVLAITLCIIMIFSLTACNIFGGNVRNVKIKTVESKIYSEEDIKSAINTIIKEFDRDWDGCTLKEIYYAGDKTTRYEMYRAEDYDMDEVIVLKSTFYVDSSGGDGSLNPDSTYENWNWILIRQKGGAWEHIDHGY
jgi:hypothetical protein